MLYIRQHLAVLQLSQVVERHGSILPTMQLHPD